MLQPMKRLRPANKHTCHKAADSAAEFRKLSCVYEDHVTPFGSKQHFVFFSFIKARKTTYALQALNERAASVYFQPVWYTPLTDRLCF